MPPPFADLDESPRVTPKSEPRGSPFPTPNSRASIQPHPRRRQREDDDAGNEYRSIDGTAVSLGNSVFSRSSQRRRVDRDTGVTPSNDRMEDIMRSRPTYVPRPAEPEREQPEMPLPFADAPAYRKIPILRVDELDADQRRVVNLAVLQKKNVCSVAEAGTGKSVTCRVIVAELSDIGKHVSVVTPSGTAAVNVRAVTLHSFYGMGGETNKGIDDFKRNMKPTVKERLAKLDTLIIDEISMVSCEMFDRMDQMTRHARNNNDEPFGGVQLIVFGDFCQLPPVKPWEHCFHCGRRRETAIATLSGRRRGKGGLKVWRCSEHGDIPKEDKMWAFKSKLWDQMGFEYIELKQVHRQLDPVFLELLRNARMGKPFKSREVALLRDHQHDVTNAVQLVSRKEDAKNINRRNLNRLAGEELRYKCQDDFQWQRDLHPELADLTKRSWGLLDALDDHPYQPWVCLKQGQPVILQKNLDVEKCLVNGSQGVIDHFAPYDEASHPQYSGDNDDFGSSSRFNRVRDFMFGGNYDRIPMVKFNNLDELVPIHPDCSISERGFEEPHSLLMRTQIPLLAGWAITIHKAQGMTLDKAVVHLEHCWQPGMSYVALSRVRTLGGLKVLGLDTHDNEAMDDEVKTFLQAKFQTVFD